MLKMRFFRPKGTYQNWLKPLRVVDLDVGAWRVVYIDVLKKNGGCVVIDLGVEPNKKEREVLLLRRGNSELF